MTGMTKWIAGAASRSESISRFDFRSGGTRHERDKRERAKEKAFLLEDNDPELISRSFHLIDLISPGPEQVDR